MTGQFDVYSGGNKVVYGNGIATFTYGRQDYSPTRKIRDSLQEEGITHENFQSGTRAVIAVKANNIVKARRLAQELLEKLADQQAGDEEFHQKYTAFKKAIQTQPKIGWTRIGKFSVFNSMEGLEKAL